VSDLFQDETFEATCPKVASSKDYIEFRESRSVLDGRPGELFVFCDGSSSGWHGACLVDPGVSWERKHRFREPCRTKNVGPEFAGLHLALSMVPAFKTVVVVFDMLGLGQWMLGHFRRNDEIVKKAYHACWDLIEEKQLQTSWVHHRGHQKDPSHFTFFNNEVDFLSQADVPKEYLRQASWPPFKLKGASTLA